VAQYLEKTRLKAPPKPNDYHFSKETKEPPNINVEMFERPLLFIIIIDILKKTHNFNKTNIIGDGGFGTNYQPRSILNLDLPRIERDQIP
jgi:hypothetical protein